MAEPKLPGWAKMKNGRVFVDPEKYFPAYMKELDVKELDQYWAEVIHQFMKMDIQEAMGCFGVEVIKISIMNRPKYKISNLPDKGGNGIYRATKNKEARQLYEKMRGSTPKDCSVA